MSTLALPPEVALIADRLQQGLIPDKIYLFGSHARGDAGPDSDFDFLVVVPDSKLSRYERAVQARRILGKIGVAVDIIVLTRTEWESETRVVCSLSSTALREGVCLQG